MNLESRVCIYIVAFAIVLKDYYIDFFTGSIFSNFIVQPESLPLWIIFIPMCVSIVKLFIKINGKYDDNENKK